jgi:hypothetical protein
MTATTNARLALDTSSAQRLMHRQPLASAAHSRLMVLTLRAWARATQWQAGELDLHEAVDTLQAAAVRDGLVAKLGKDRVQDIIAAAFAAVRDDLIKFEAIKTEPAFADDASSELGWRDAAVDYRKHRGARVGVTSYTARDLARLRELMADNVTFERAWAEVSKPTGIATSTLQAAEFLALTGDIPRLQRWLAQHSAQERKAIRKHLEATRCRSRQKK